MRTHDFEQTQLNLRWICTEIAKERMAHVNVTTVPPLGGRRPHADVHVSVNVHANMNVRVLVSELHDDVDLAAETAFGVGGVGRATLYTPTILPAHSEPLTW